MIAFSSWLQGRWLDNCLRHFPFLNQLKCTLRTLRSVLFVDCIAFFCRSLSDCFLQCGSSVAGDWTTWRELAARAGVCWPLRGRAPRINSCPTPSRQLPPALACRLEISWIADQLTSWLVGWLTSRQTSRLASWLGDYVIISSGQ